jgi:hypothetical protein
MFEAGEDEEDESWLESLTDANREPDQDSSDDWLGDHERHPLLERVMDLNKRLYGATLKSLQHDIYAELARLREAREPE